MSRVNKWMGIAVVFTMALFNETAWAQSAANVQSKFYATNVKKIDSFNLFLKNWCDSVKPITITNKSVKQDKENLRYVSKLYNTNMSYKDFLRDADKNDLVISHSMRAGLIGMNEFKIDEQHGYLSIDIWFTVIDDNIIYKKFVIGNTAKRKCASGGGTDPIPFFDYVYVKKELVNEIDFHDNLF